MFIGLNLLNQFDTLQPPTNSAYVGINNAANASRVIKRNSQHLPQSSTSSSIAQQGPTPQNHQVLPKRSSRKAPTISSVLESIRAKKQRNV